MKSKNFYKYDEKGNMIEKTSYDLNGNLQNQIIYKYDDKGNVIEEKWLGIEKTSVNYGQSYINALNGIAWVLLICGIIGAIIIWSTMGSIPDPGYTYIVKKITNPEGILLGFQWLFFSVSFSCFLFVISVMAKNLIEIRKHI